MVEVITEVAEPEPLSLEAENSKPLTGGLRVVDAPGGKKALGYIKNNKYSEHFIKVPSGGGTYAIDLYASSGGSGGTSGTYAIDLYAASAGSGGTIDFMIGGNKITTLNAPKTNGWDDYKKVSTTNNVRINGGVKTIRLVYKGSGNFLFNVDGLVFRNASGGGGGNNNAPLTCANAPTYNPSTTYSPGQRVINNNDRRLYERTASGWDYIAQCDRSSNLDNKQSTNFKVAAVNNKNNTELNIQSMSGGDIAVNVYNLAGQSVYSESFNTPAPLVTIRLDKTNLSSGLYVAKISLNGKTQTLKFAY